jgi:hypothetical protein
VDIALYPRYSYFLWRIQLMHTMLTDFNFSRRRKSIHIRIFFGLTNSAVEQNPQITYGFSLKLWRDSHSVTVYLNLYIPMEDHDSKILGSSVRCGHRRSGREKAWETHTVVMVSKEYYERLIRYGLCNPLVTYDLRGYTRYVVWTHSSFMYRSPSDDDSNFRLKVGG